jgi:hypothetical protein
MDGTVMHSNSRFFNLIIIKHFPNDSYLEHKHNMNQTTHSRRWDNTWLQFIPDRETKKKYTDPSMRTTL